MTRLPAEELAELRLVEVDRLPAQEVLDLDVADAGDLDLALEDVVEARNDANADLDLPAEADEPQDLLAGDLRDRDHDLGNAQLLDQARQVFGRAQDAEAVDHGAPLFGIVVDEPLDLQARVAAALDLARRQDPGPARPDQERRLLLRRFPPARCESCVASARRGNAGRPAARARRRTPEPSP